MKEVAKRFLEAEAHQDLAKCFVTEDGNVYHPRHEHIAKEHARENGLSVQTFTREDIKDKKKAASTSKSTSKKGGESKGGTKKDS